MQRSCVGSGMARPLFHKVMSDEMYLGVQPVVFPVLDERQGEQWWVVRRAMVLAAAVVPHKWRDGGTARHEAPDYARQCAECRSRSTKTTKELDDCPALQTGAKCTCIKCVCVCVVFVCVRVIAHVCVRTHICVTCVCICERCVYV